MTSQDPSISEPTPSSVDDSSASNSPSAGFQRHSGPAPARRNSQFTIPPPGLAEDLADSLGERDDFAPEQAIDSQIAELEAWARANASAERLDSLRFWGTRVLSFLGATGAAAAAARAQTELAVFGGIFAASAIVVDVAWPSFGDRLARRRAIHDLRELQHNLKIKWDKVRLAHPNPAAPKRIAHALVLLDQIQAKREEIGRYLGDACPGVGRRARGR